jgi:hypothetical protein
MENVDNDETIAQGIDRINASFFDDAGNRASGLCLEEIGLDGHVVANMLWRISSYLRRRAESRPRSLPIDNVPIDGEVL